MQKTCAQCAFHIKTPSDNYDGKCGIFGHAIHLAGNACSKFNDNPYTCDLCHRVIVENPIIDIDNETGKVKRILCAECNSKFGTCLTCENTKNCKFEEDPSPIPKMVQKQIRQGNMVSVMNVPNIERIRETCQKGCLCFQQENGCNRQNNQTCINYKEI